MSQKIQTLSGYIHEYQKSVLQPEEFWGRVAESFHWKKPWDKTLEWDFTGPNIKWFVNGKLNITENILDRHLFTKGDDTAIIWEPNDPNTPHKSYTYKELHAEVCRAANMLKANGIEKGDRVCFYMPMVPELAIAVLACARVGAIHSVVFAGFSAKALADRIKDADCKMVITSDGNFRGAKKIPVNYIIRHCLDID